jgi:hypothetical protein
VLFLPLLFLLEQLGHKEEVLWGGENFCFQSVLEDLFSTGKEASSKSRWFQNPWHLIFIVQFGFSGRGFGSW